MYSTPVPSDGLTASFTAQIGGGSGGDGMTFALLSASGNNSRSLGGGGGGLGVAGLPGVAVALDTFSNGADPSNNFVGISTGATGGALTYVATSTSIPNLRSGPHGVTVTVSGTTITVFLDGAQRLSVNVPGLAPAVLPAFTGGTGTATDLHAAHDISISSGGTKLPPPGTGWRFNGSADVAGSQVVLTPAATSRAGTALYTDPIATDGLTASFNLSIGGGTGADGAALVLLDPAKASPTSVGGAGGGLGFAGLAGVAVSFVTYPQGGIDSHNFVGIETGTAGGAASFLASTTNVPDLRARSHDVVVSVSGSTIGIAIDGTDVLSQLVPALKPTALVGFSAGTGALTDVHAITDAQVVSGRTAMPVPATGWSLNGSTTLSGGTVQLTAAVAGQAGTAIYATPVPTAHLQANFTMAIGGGTGADGLTFMLLDPARERPVLGRPQRRRSGLRRAHRRGGHLRHVSPERRRVEQLRRHRDRHRHRRDLRHHLHRGTRPAKRNPRGECCRHRRRPRGHHRRVGVVHHPGRRDSGNQPGRVLRRHRRAHRPPRRERPAHRVLVTAAPCRDEVSWGRCVSSRGPDLFRGDSGTLIEHPRAGRCQGTRRGQRAGDHGIVVRKRRRGPRRRRHLPSVGITLWCPVSDGLSGWVGEDPAPTASLAAYRAASARPINSSEVSTPFQAVTPAEKL